MGNIKYKFQKIKKSYLGVAGILLLLLLAVFLVWFNNSNSMQAMPSMIGSVYFDGEYRIGDGEWQQIVEGEHIPSTEGDVTLRGNFHMLDPEGGYEGVYRYEIPIAFFLDHINLTFYEVGSEPYVMDTENSLYGDSVCGVRWEAYTLTSASEDTIEILIHNPHSFGNETAIDEMLSKTALWTGIDFENSASEKGDTQRTVGMIMMLISIVFLGIALFSTLIHIKNSKFIWFTGLGILFAGLYFSYHAEGVYFYSESTVSNTTILGASMMFYMLFLCILITCLLKTMQKASNIAVVLLGVANAVFFVLPLITEVCFYDTWAWWSVVQLIANAVIAVCLVREFFLVKTKERWLYSGQTLKDMMEMAVMSWPDEDGSFPHLSGITFSVNTAIPSSVVVNELEEFVEISGEYRVYDIEVFDKETGKYEPLSLGKTYTLAASNYFLLEYGSGMTMLKNAKIIQNEGMLDIEVLERYIVETLDGTVGEEYAEVKANITFTDGVIEDSADNNNQENEENNNQGENQTNTPQPKDTSHTVVWIILAVVVFSGLIVLIIVIKKRR